MKHITNQLIQNVFIKKLCPFVYYQHTSIEINVRVNTLKNYYIYKYQNIKTKIYIDYVIINNEFNIIAQSPLKDK